MRDWPLAGDSPLVQARRTANAYRAALHEADPDRCAVLDTQFSRWGQTWAIPRVVANDPDEWLKPRDAANLAAISVDTLRQWRKRGLIKGRKRNGRWEYQVAELWKLSAAVRGRQRDVTDTLPSSGRSVPTLRLNLCVVDETATSDGS